MSCEKPQRSTKTTQINRCWYFAVIENINNNVLMLIHLSIKLIAVPYKYVDVIMQLIDGFKNEMIYKVWTTDLTHECVYIRFIARTIHQIQFMQMAQLKFTQAYERTEQKSGFQHGLCAQCTDVYTQPSLHIYVWLHELWIRFWERRKKSCQIFYSFEHIRNWV